MPKNIKYTKELLAPLVASSFSVAQVIKKLGLILTGGTYTNIKRWIRVYELDTTHFTGRGTNRGPSKKGGPSKKTADELLVLGNPLDRPVNSYKIRRALAEIGRPYICEECGLLPVWNGKPLSLQLDHKNGHRWDNRPENVRFVDPNCHSQTDNFGSKNKHAGVV